MKAIKVIGLLLSALALLLVGCGKKNAANTDRPTLFFCSEGSPEGFDPGLYTAATTFDAAYYPVYNGLLEFKEGSTEVEPALAQSWDISDDGKEYTFYLRPGVRFHTTSFFTPTREMNADDVVFSLSRQIDDSHPWNKYVTGASWFYAQSIGFPELISKIEKIDDLTVKVTLSRRDATFLPNLAMPTFPIVSAEYAQSLAAAGEEGQLNQKPLGTGPFVFVNYQQDSNIRYKANENYWGMVPKIDLVFNITPDASVRYQKLKSGECHVMPYPNSADIELMRQDAGIKLVEQEGLNVGYLAFNTTKKPFDDVRVRRAISMAVDKKTIVDTVFQGNAKIAKNPMPPAVWSYNEAVQDYPYDIAKARQLLRQAGIERLKIKLWALPIARPYMPNGRRAAEIIQGNLAKIGIQAEIVVYEWGEYIKRAKSVDRDGISMNGWTGDLGDPDNFLYTLLSCDAVGINNYAQWCNAEFDKLVKQAKVATDKAQRAKLYEQAQLIAKREAPWVPLVHGKVIVPVRKEVKNFVKSPQAMFNFKNVEID